MEKLEWIIRVYHLRKLFLFNRFHNSLHSYSSSWRPSREIACVIGKLNYLFDVVLQVPTFYLLRQKSVPPIATQWSNVGNWHDEMEERPNYHIRKNTCSDALIVASILVVLNNSLIQQLQTSHEISIEQAFLSVFFVPLLLTFPQLTTHKSSLNRRKWASISGTLCVSTCQVSERSQHSWKQYCKIMSAETILKSLAIAR